MLGTISERLRLIACADALASLPAALVAAASTCGLSGEDCEELGKAAVFTAWVESNTRTAIAEMSIGFMPVGVLQSRRPPVGLALRPELPHPLLGGAAVLTAGRRQLARALEAMAGASSDSGIAICASLQQLFHWTSA